MLFFASARELVGESSLILDVDVTATTNAVLDILCDQYPKLNLAKTTLSIAVNRKYINKGELAQLQENDEMALLPPISGG